MNRDSLYRDCALQAGLVQLANTDEHGRTFEHDDVERVVGGAWVTCQVYISNGEVSELLSRERKERRLEAVARVDEEWREEWDLESLKELQDTPRRGDG